MVTETSPPTIEFPCDGYPIKVIGESDPGLTASVVAIVRTHDTAFEEASVSLNASSRGSYTAVRLSIRATGEASSSA